MSVSSLREITIGVSSLRDRVMQFETGCGLSVLASGALAPITASRLFENPAVPNVAVMGRADVAGSPRIRLVEMGEGKPARVGGIAGPGPLGVGFTTLPVHDVYSRLERLGVQFLSPPVLLTPKEEAGPKGTPPRPQRFEAFGRTADGDFIVLIERFNAQTSYGTFGSDCSEPLHVSFVVTNLDASLHFMSDVLEHETLLAEQCSGPPFDRLLGMESDVSFRFAMLHRAGWPTGRTLFIEFEKKPQPMTQIPSLARGVCRLRYDTTDMHATLARVPGGGGSLVRGPASVDDPVLGQGLVALIRSPFGVVIELWETP
jgi:catechol 2,3-dioxygenase-like lactoylglutathione lyase family enzyme